MKTGKALAVAAIILSMAGQPLAAADPQAPITDDQLAVLMFVDQGRSFGYQTMMARIQLDKVKAELERDRVILERNEALHAKGGIPLIELEIAQLKDAWNRKQLVVAEKSLAFVAAEYEIMRLAARHFGGEGVSVQTLYVTFLRGWEAGCDKGPDEVVAMKAWADYAAKSLERARQLNERGSLPLSEVLEREAQLEIARSNYVNREAGLEKCRTVLFPSIDEILAVGE
jgi:hypothetical protein